MASARSPYVHIMDMNKRYQELHTSLTDAPEHLSEYREGDFVPFPDFVHRDIYFDALVKPSDVDDQVATILTLLLPSLCLLVA